MSDINNTLKKKENQYHHLTEKDRATIQALIEQKDENGKRLFNNTYIADYLGVHRSTIYRELKNRKSYRFMVRSGRTNEKQNSMIRYFIPKKTLIENYSCEDINNVANWMNNYPRKSLNYKTPLEAVLEEFNDKSILNKIYKLQEVVNTI